MPTLTEPSLEPVVHATRHAERFSARLAHLLSFVPDDRLAWTPAPTAKSPLRIVAHCAVTNVRFADIIVGNLPVAMPTPEEFFRGIHEDEAKVDTREHALALLERTTATLCDALATVDAESLETSRDSPFGAIPVRFWMAECGNHMAGHAGQLDYMQTIWGDLDPHLG